MKPATPLPWSSQHNKRTTFREPHGAVYSVAQTLDGGVGKTYKDQDAAYIAHAANAYPKLVAALKDALAMTRPDDMGAIYASNRRLIKELGEETQ